MKKLNKKGFTLVELLAVIVILGVIMLIALPSIQTIIKNSRKSSFVSSGQMYISTMQNIVASEVTDSDYCVDISKIANDGKYSDKSPINNQNITGVVIYEGGEYTAYISDTQNYAIVKKDSTKGAVKDSEPSTFVETCDGYKAPEGYE